MKPGILEIVLIITAACLVSSQTYNDECTTDSNCNTSAILKCDTTTRRCVCENPDEQSFDQNKQACVAHVGYHCDHDEDDGLHCVEGGYCYAHNEDGVHIHECACKLGWLPTSELTCNNPTGYDNDCTTESDCNPSKILKCDPTSKKCVCQKPDEQIFDQNKQACVSRVGFGCDHDGSSLTCVEGAFCDMPVINGVMTHRCACNSGYTVTEDKLCSGANGMVQMTFLLLVLVAALISKTIL